MNVNLPKRNAIDVNDVDLECNFVGVDLLGEKAVIMRKSYHSSEIICLDFDPCDFTKQNSRGPYNNLEDFCKLFREDLTEMVVFDNKVDFCAWLVS